MAKRKKKLVVKEISIEVPMENIPIVDESSVPVRVFTPKGDYVRTYSLGLNGKNYKEVAEDFAKATGFLLRR